MSLTDLTFNCDTSHLISQPPWASHSLMSDTMRASTPPPPLFLSVLPFISLPPSSHSHPPYPFPSLSLSPPIICVVSVCSRLWIWDDEANVLLAANYINALSSLNCLSLPAQPFPNTGALSCLSRGWLLRAWVGPEVGGGETHVTVEDKQTHTQSINSGLHTSRHTVSGHMEMFWTIASRRIWFGSTGKIHVCYIFATIWAEWQSELCKPPVHYCLQLLNTSIFSLSVLRNVQVVCSLPILVLNASVVELSKEHLFNTYKALHVDVLTTTQRSWTCTFKLIPS